MISCLKSFIERKKTLEEKEKEEEKFCTNDCA